MMPRDEKDNEIIINYISEINLKNELVNLF